MLRAQRLLAADQASVAILGADNHMPSTGHTTEAWLDVALPPDGPPFYHELVGPFGSETKDNHLQRPRQPREFSWEERSAPLEDHLAARHRNPRGESQRVQRRNLQRGWQLVTGTEETASGGVRVEGRNVYATHSRATDLSGESIHRVTNSFLSSYFRFTLLEYTDHCTMPRIPGKFPHAVQSPILRVC
jgi:hypothetical protein